MQSKMLNYVVVKTKKVRVPKVIVTEVVSVVPETIAEVIETKKKRKSEKENCFVPGFSPACAPRAYAVGDVELLFLLVRIYAVAALLFLQYMLHK